MPRKKTKKYFTTGDVAREVGCDDLTVRRWLADKNIKRPEGAQFRFNERQFGILVRRIGRAHILYPSHVRRYEKPVNGNPRICLF